MCANNEIFKFIEGLLDEEIIGLKLGASRYVLLIKFIQILKCGSFHIY